MDIKELNRISIKEYLSSKGIDPIKDRGYYGMYYSPFREDTNASMKVDYNKNLWIDFGSNEGGTMIDLVMRMENCSFHEAVTSLERSNVRTYQRCNVPTDSLSFHGNTPTQEKERETAMRITSIGKLNTPALLDYLKERSIDTDIAKQQCKEINYTVNDKFYYGIGFRNKSGGYEIRNPYFKGCIAPKDISLVQQTEKQDVCLVFEGFMDYLSFLTLRKNQNPQFPQDAIVLNSVSNLNKSLVHLKDYKEIHTYLDNDDVGKKTTQQIGRWSCTQNCIHIDKSTMYINHKDLNEFLCANKHLKIAEQNKVDKPTSQPPKRKNRGLRM